MLINVFGLDSSCEVDHMISRSALKKTEMQETSCVCVNVHVQKGNLNPQIHHSFTQSTSNTALSGEIRKYTDKTGT